MQDELQQLVEGLARIERKIDELLGKSKSEEEDQIKIYQEIR